jgi:hypothetical protein
LFVLGRNCRHVRRRLQCGKAIKFFVPWELVVRAASVFIPQAIKVLAIFVLAIFVLAIVVLVIVVLVIVVLVIVVLVIVVLVIVVLVRMVIIKVRVVIPTSRSIVLERVFHCNDGTVGLTPCSCQNFPPVAAVLNLLSAQDPGDCRVWQNAVRQRDRDLPLGKKRELGLGHAGSLCLRSLVVSLNHEQFARFHRRCFQLAMGASGHSVPLSWLNGERR